MVLSQLAEKFLLHSNGFVTLSREASVTLQWFCHPERSRRV